MKITETKDYTATVIGAEAILFEMLTYAFQNGLLEDKPVEFTSSYFNWIDKESIYWYNKEGIEALIKRAKNHDITLTCDAGEEDAGIKWTMELVHDK